MIRDHGLGAGNQHRFPCAEGGGTLCNDPLGCGTVFKLDASGVETTLYAFTGRTEGSFPESSLIRDATGNFYGTTEFDGAHFLGVVFKLARSSNLVP